MMAKIHADGCQRFPDHEGDCEADLYRAGFMDGYDVSNVRRDAMEPDFRDCSAWRLTHPENNR